MKFLKQNYVLVLLLLFIAIGFFLRYDNLYIWPRHGATFDEFAWTWQGINLIQKGIPISWSPHTQYLSYELIKYQGADFRLVTPFLEHPPLFGLIAGGFAYLNGATDMYSVTLNIIRPLALIMGTLSVVLVFLITKEIYDKKTALIASGLYAIVPTIVIGSRIVQNENFFIPVWLGIIYLIFKYLKTKNRNYRNVSAILCGLLVLAKIPWIAAAGSVFLLLIYFKRYRDSLLFIIAPLVGLFIFFLYGYYFDKDLFFKLWSLQIARYDLGFASVFALFEKPYLVDRFYLDGWVYFGWFSFILLLTNFKKHIYIVLPLISYFIIFTAGIPDEPGHGWYRYPFYPFLIISLAVFIREYFGKNQILTFVFLMLTGLSLLELTWSRELGFSFILFRGYIILCMVSMASVFHPKFSKLSKITSYISLSVVIALSIWAVLLYNEF